MIIIEIRCDHEDRPSAQDVKAKCHSRSGSSPSGQHRDHTTALAQARTKARDAGWHFAEINRNRNRGWLCPPCYERHQESK